MIVEKGKLNMKAVIETPKVNEANMPELFCKKCKQQKQKMVLDGFYKILQDQFWTFFFKQDRF